MTTSLSAASLRAAWVCACIALGGQVANAATTVVNLTAQRMSTALPDGANVPMWGYCNSGDATVTPAVASTCTASWAPGPTIVVPYDATPNATNTLQIRLLNKLPTATSIVILGQLGGGLGTGASNMPAFGHAPQTTTTWPANGTATFTPPQQPDRVFSFSTAVPGNATDASTPVTLQWDNLKPGTYLYETGTLPSVQAPMGLYGVLVVTQAPVANTPLVPGNAYPNTASGVSYDSDASLLFSEIDPVQNTAVDAAAADGADVRKRFDDPTCSAHAKCYPAAVNYTPTYFLINGKAFDKSAPQQSAFALAGTSTAAGSYSSGKLLVRLLNAGLRTHIPTIVGLPMTIVAEDGNLLPGNPKVQNEVLLTAGKTHDVLITPPGGSGVYLPKTYPLFDRQLSVTSANVPDGGMQGFLQIANAGAATGALPAAVTPTAVDDSFQVPLSASVNGNVKLNDIAVAAVAQTGTGPLHGSVSLNADGSFVYSPVAGYIGTDSFQYVGNGGTTNVATVTLKVASSGTGGVPVAQPDSFSSNVATSIGVSSPGVLANDSDPSGYPLTAVLAGIGTCSSVTLNADGSFTATPAPVAPTSTPTAAPAASCQFSYTVKNTQGTPSAAATVSVSFLPAGMKTGLNVTVIDPDSKAAVTDYRWIIQEDLTFKVDPTGTPSLATRTLGTSFHKSHMPVVASGCVGPISCGSGQTVRIDSTTIDPLTQTLGARHVVTDAEALAKQVTPDQAALDPAKHYYISILPGDAGDGGGAPADTSTIPPTPAVPPGHAMGGAYISPQANNAWAPITIASNAYPWTPAQLSIFIYEDNAPVNGQNDLNEVGLGGFNIILVDAVGRSGDPAGQQTYDASGMPLSNALLGRPGCPDDRNPLTNGSATSAAGNKVGVIYTCPNAPPGYAGDPAVYALAGHALVVNVTPARYDVIAHPGAAREGAGEVWWQTETLEGTPAQDAFTGVKEPVYFQEFGPPGFHTTIGFTNPDHIKAAGSALLASLPAATPTYSVSGRITNQHMTRPSDVTLWDSGSYDLLSSTTCQVAINSQGGNGAAIAVTSCDRDGNFTLTGVPSGTYEIVIWDQWLDQIIQTAAVTVGTSNVALGNLPVLSWFTQYDQNIFQDLNLNGVYDGNEPGISNVTMTTRYRDGGISNQTATDSSGNGLLAELFPLFNWYVTEADTTRFKQTGVTVIVDGGGKTDTTGEGAGLYSSKYATGESSVRTELPGAYSYGMQGFISQRNTINWGRAPYASNENGGIQGVVVYSTTRPFDDQRYNVQTLWEPLVPRVTVNLYRKEKLPDGTPTLTKVDTTLTSSWDDFVNQVDASGKQVNMQCPGQVTTDPFYLYTLNGTDKGRCYDGWHDWNQVQAAPYDGRYAFPSAAYIAAHPLTAAQTQAGQTLVSLPPGEYVVETVTPPGYQVVKEEDKNILNGDSFVAPAVTQFGGIGNIFILPDQATLNNANPYAPRSAEGVANNATSDLGVTSSLINQPECVGSMHRVPDYLSLFPQGGLVAPFAGMDRPLCDRKLVKLVDQVQATANFFVFTEVPTAANGTGIILDDASSEFNAAAPDFGEKASVPFVPVSIKDFNGREVGRSYSDQWGAYNVMTPSSWLVNPPTPSGYGPNMLVTCINDPGPILLASGQMGTDPQYSPSYSNFCYTLPFMPGRTTYLDTPVLPVAAFASGSNQADCAYPDVTPAVSRVDSAAGFGPYLTAAGGVLTITALGDKEVPNPAYAGPFATTGPTSLRNVTRHYDFRGGKGSVKIGNIDLTAAITSWTNTTITLSVPANTPSGELVITDALGNKSVDTVTVTVENRVPVRVQGASGGKIQAALDAATPGDLILIDAGTYNELVIMWKPVRLQGVGAASVIINAAKYPTSKLEAWRPTINSLFSIDITTGNQTGTAQVDPLPTQEITGGVVLLEPSVLGTEEGAGITVLAKNLPATQCSGGAISTFGKPVTQSNFRCAPSRIDGVSVTGGDAGGGIYVNGWAHNLEIANNRVYGNAGAFHGGVRVGVPYLEEEALPVTGPLNTVVGFGYDTGVKIHHNAITKNGTVEGPGGNGGAGGGVSICTGTDGYSVDHNWVCGNYGSSDGGGIGHLGFSQGGSIVANKILFNQSFQQTSSTHGGGIVVTGEPAVAGTLPLGTGNVTIDANVIRGNLAEGGHGGGVRLQQVNGADVQLHPNASGQWFKVTLTNNIIDNNIAGWGGGGISMADALVSVVDNNTVSSNDSVGIAGTVLSNGVPLPAASGGVAGTGEPSPAGISADPTSAILKAAIGPLAALTPTQKAISSPELIDNILWKNRSFFYKVVAGKSSLCSSNAVADAGGTTCNQLLDQATTGQCTNTGAGAPAYWDLGVLGDASATPGATKLSPAYSVMTSIAGYGGGVQTATITHAAVALRIATLTTSAAHGFLAGQTVTVSGVSNAGYNGSFTIAAVLSPTSFTFADNNFTLLQANSINTGGSAAVTLPSTNSASDPLLADAYCNGSRVVPELPGVINPPSPKNLQVAATADEGNNYVNLRFGPLYLAKPNAAATAYTPFGDYHITSASPAKDTGTPLAGNTHDVDGDTRGPGATGVNGPYDIGADEIRRTSPIATLTATSLVFGSQPVGSTSAAQSVTVTNTGTAALVFNAATPTATAGVSISAGFTIAAGSTCVNGGTVAVGGSCVLNVAFSPAAPGGAKTGTLTLRDNAGTQTVGLSGTATQGAVSFTAASLGTLSNGLLGRTLAFGDRTGATVSIVTLTNTGTASVTYGAATVTNSLGTAFTKGADGCSGSTVAVNGTCTITINFAGPAGTSLRSGSLNVPDNAANSPQSLLLTGS